MFLAERIVPRKRVGFVIGCVTVSTRSPSSKLVGAPSIPRVVPDAVLTALRTAANDDNSTIAAEALYAFGSLGANVYGRDRDALLTRSASSWRRRWEIRITGWESSRPGRRAPVWRRPGEGAIDMTLGDALVTTLNDRAPSVRRGAMNALGAARYERSVQALTDMVLHYEHGPDTVAGMFALAIAHASSAALFNQALVGRDALLKAAAIRDIARSGTSRKLAVWPEPPRATEQRSQLSGEFR